MQKKTYTAPEADIEKFLIKADVMTLSAGIDEELNQGSGEGADLDF